MDEGSLSDTQRTMVLPLLQETNIRGKPYITVSAKGIVNGLSRYPNDGADFGPDTTKGATAPGQYGGTYTETSGIQEAVNFDNNIVLLFGTFLISAQISIINSNTSIYGAGIISPTSSLNGDAILIDVDSASSVTGATAPYIQNIKIYGLTFDMVNAPANSNGIHVKYTGAATANSPYFNFLFKDLYFKNISMGTHYYDGAGIYMTSNNVNPSGLLGVMISNITSYNCNITIEDIGCTGVEISNISIMNSTNQGIALGQSNTADSSLNLGPSSNHVLTNVQMYGVSTLTWSGSNQNLGLLLSCSDFMVQGLLINSFGYGINIAPPEAQPCSLSNINVSVINGIGIGINTLQYTMLKMSGVHVFDCGINTGLSAALRSGINNGSGYLFMSNCSIYDNGGYGIYLGGYTGYTEIYLHDIDMLNGNLPNTAGSIYIGSYPNVKSDIRNVTGFTPDPTISANPPVSGTAYQNTNLFDIEIDLPVYATTSGTAGYVTIAKGASSSSLTTIGSQFVNGSTSSTSTDIIKLRVPAGWYYEFTESGVTLGTASVFAE